MAPIPRLRLDDTLPLGQTTIFSALNGSLGVARPPPPLRLGPKPKTTGHADTPFGQRLIGGLNKRQVIKLFANSRLAADAGERGDEDIVKGIHVEEEDDTDDEFLLVHRQHKYTQEQKLAAIDYFTTTWRALKDNTYKRLSIRYAAKRLKITQRMLKN
jgi:hypothetical protein